MGFLTEVKTLFEYTRGLRRDFYRYPELGYHEAQTAGVIARELNSFRLAVTTGIAASGMGREAEVKLKEVTPPVVNDPNIAKWLGALAAAAIELIN